MNVPVFLSVALVIILIIYGVLSEDYKNSEIRYIEYVHQAHKMLSKAIHDYNFDCIRNHTKPLGICFLNSFPIRISSKKKN